MAQEAQQPATPYLPQVTNWQSRQLRDSALPRLRRISQRAKTAMQLKCPQRSEASQVRILPGRNQHQPADVRVLAACHSLAQTCRAYRSSSPASPGQAEVTARLHPKLLHDCTLCSAGKLQVIRKTPSGLQAATPQIFLVTWIDGVSRQPDVLQSNIDFDAQVRCAVCPDTQAPDPVWTAANVRTRHLTEVRLQPCML